MMDSDSEQIREVYAHYGLAMFLAQGLERTLSMILASQYGAEAITEWSYDDRLAEHFDSTFGTLAKKFSDFAHQRGMAWAAEVEAAAAKRNWLAHHYFWVKAVEFCSSEGRNRMLAELRDLIGAFEELDNKLSAVNREFREARGIDDKKVKEIEQRMLSGQEAVVDPLRLEKTVRIVSAHRWHFDPQSASKSGLLFKTETGKNVVLTDNGLCLGPPTVPSDALEPDHRFDHALPADVNTKPKRAEGWNYRLAFGSMFELWVRGQKINGRFTYRAEIRKKASKQGANQVGKR